MTKQTRPEPVMDGAKLASAVSGLVTSVGAGIVLVGWATGDQVEQWASVAGGIVTALGALLAVAMPLATARQARGQVTPLADPRDNAGQPLAARYVVQPQQPGVADHAPRE